MHISEIFGLYKCGMRVRGVGHSSLSSLINSFQSTQKIFEVDCIKYT